MGTVVVVTNEMKMLGCAVPTSVYRVDYYHVGCLPDTVTGTRHLRDTTLVEREDPTVTIACTHCLRPISNRKIDRRRLPYGRRADGNEGRRVCQVGRIPERRFDDSHANDIHWNHGRRVTYGRRWSTRRGVIEHVGERPLKLDTLYFDAH